MKSLRFFSHVFSFVAIYLLLSPGNLSAQCPVIQFEDLRGVIGFPQFDNTSQCGDADTLSILVFTDAPGEILGFDLQLKLVDGLKYGGFADTHYGGGTSIAYAGGPASGPKFSLSGVTDPDDVMVANIGLVPDCNLDLSKLYDVSIEYEYTFQDTMGNIIECEGTYDLSQELNSALKRPELNMDTPSPSVANITSLGTPRCQNIDISQDGLQASINEMEFAVCGFASDGNLTISTLTANGIALPFVENAMDSTVVAAIDGSYFLSNTSPNPTDLKFNTGEKMRVRICYNADVCPEISQLPLTYKAFYGCDGDTCNITTQASFLNIVPTGASDPIVTASFAGPLEVCGSEGTVSLELENPSTADFQNAYTDLQIGFETCEQTNLDVVAVRLNGMDLPSTAFGWEGDDLFVTFADLDMDFDGMGTGLEDLDMDGKVDDLGGGQSIALELDIAVLCGVNEVDATSLDCPSIDCGFATFYVRAKSNCGNQFTKFPSVPDPFSIEYGPTAVSNVGEVNLGDVDAPLFGYDLGQIGEKPMGTTLTGMTNLELCYDFNSVNMSPCPSGADLSFKMSFSGDARLVQDFEVIPGSMSYTVDGGTPNALADGTEVWMPDPMDAGKRMLIVSGGSETGTVCYQVGIQLDTAYCSPVQYVAVSQQVIEYCSDCDCELVKACKNTQFAIDPEYFDCPCLVGHTILPSRKNYGFADHAMTMPLTKEDVLASCPQDVNRYTVGDTMEVEVAYDIKDLDAFNNMNMWQFRTYFYDPNGIGSIAYAQGLPVIPDANAGGIMAIEINTGSGRYSFSFDELASCESGDTQVGFPALSQYGNRDYSSMSGVNRSTCGNSGTDFRDQLTNNLYIRNAQQSNECGGATSTGGNCLQDFFDLHNFEVGDSIFLHYEFPMIRNPLRAAAIAAGFNPPLSNQMRLHFLLNMHNYDEFSTTQYCYTANSTSCGGEPVVDVADFGGVTAFTEMELDNCGGEVKHTFSITNPPPVGWYNCEFKPLINIDDVDLPLIGPLAYCNMAEVTDYDGNTSSVTVDSTINLNCTPVAGYDEDLCAIETGDLGYVVMDLASQGVRPLGVGLMNDDSLTLEYNLCMLCPSDFALNYELIYDYSLVSQRELESCGFRCNQGTDEATTWCDELNFDQASNYYDQLMLDTLQYELDVSSMDFVVTDNRVPDAGMSASNEGADLVASGSPGTSIEYQEIELCNADASATQLNVQGSVSVPSSVSFVGAYSNSNGTGPLTTVLISDNGTVKTYSIETNANSLAVGECETVYIGTTLLFCPVAPALPPQICVNAVSGCAPAEVAAALGGSGTCGGGQTCYAYIFGEADLQTEWYETPVNAELCKTDTFYIRIKNTKTITLLDLETYITKVPGLNIDPTSWAVAYPGGSVGFNGTFGSITGDGTAATIDPAFMSVPAPILNGQVYSWADDADYIPQVDMSGLPGVFSMADSNNISIRFIGTTDCDNFLSGAKMQTETNASDPCSPGMLMSGLVDTQPIIIDGADPLDNAQILTTSQPKMAYCTGGPSTFGLTALNIGENPTSSEVQTCITIPSASLTYELGSVEFTSPAYTPMTITEVVDGDNMVVCFDSPALMAGQKFSVQFMATQPLDAVCGPIVLGMDVKSFEPAVVCATAPGMMCGVFVQNSINPSLILDMGPPLETVDVRLNRQCNSGVDPEQFCYEIDMVNPGDANYTGTIRVGIHDDVLADGFYDEIVDAELAGFDHTSVSVDAGAMVTLTMCLDVPAAQACPILIRQSFETGCACDEAITPYDNIPPAFLDTIECVVLCPGTPFTTDICGDYEFSLEPAEGGVIVSDGNTLSVTLNMGFGVDEAVVLSATESIGDCVSEATLELKSTGDYMPVNLAFEVCEGECIDPDLMIPSNISEGSTIEITQVGAATMGTDLDSSEPEICGVLGGTDTYTVTITASPTCIYTFDFTVEVLPIGSLVITDSEVCNHPLFGGTIEAETGFDDYQFFLVLPNGTEVLKYSGPLNTYNSMDEGDYVIKATNAGMCPSVGSATIEFGNCVDLALKKEIEAIVPGPYPTTGGMVEYKLTVYNQGGVEMNQIELTDFVPEGLTNNDPNWSPNGMSNGLVTRTVPTPGFAAGDSVEVSIVLTVNPGASFENTINIAEITAMQDLNNIDVSGDDIDSTPDSDPTNDAGANPNTGSDNTVDGDGTNGGGANGDVDPLSDEDDNDPATLPVFDLALTKTVDPASVPASGMFTVGDPITFFVTVINQGSVDATDVVITDLIPCGMELFDEGDAVNSGAGWGAEVVSADASSGFETQTTIASLPAGTSQQIPIKMTLAMPAGGAGHTACMVGMDPYINYGLIESALDGDGMAVVDIDSDPGTFTPEEEGTMPNAGGDNDVNSTGNLDAGSEDDSDPANIEIFDLALSKIVNPDNGPYAYGETATFEICVTNQGNVPSDDVQIIDYIPAGYMYAASNDANGWVDNGDGTATYDTDPSDFSGNSTPGQIGFLEQVCVSIDLIIQAAPGDPLAYINTAEIAGANTVTDNGMGPVSTPVTADNDSPFDTDPTNDAGGALDTPSDAMTSDSNDPAIQGNGLGTPGDEDPLTDSDDSDIAAVEIVDFALKKEIASPDAPYSYGDTLTFDITVYNQGTVTGMNITVTDYAPIGLEYIANPIVNPGWTGVSISHMFMINQLIEPGDSVVVPIKMIVTSNGSGMADYTNIAEIFSVFDEAGINITNDDVDSQPDGDPFNDPGGAAGTDSDNVVSGTGLDENGDPNAPNGSEDPLTDEDDNDPAFVQIFDLAQTKEIVGGPFTIGDLVEYTITTINQGNVPVTNVVVNDYVPAGLLFSMAENANWMFVGANPTGTTVSTMITDVIMPGDSAFTSLFLTIQASNGDADAYTNYTEISSFEDTNGNSSLTDPTIADADSTPDDDPVNDAGGNPDTDSDNSVDGDGTGNPLDEDATTDEDDQDPAMLSIPDLALIKTTVETGPFSYGDTVTFDISVINQGNIVASDVEITDYIPSGFIYNISNNPLWSYDGTVATTVIEGPVSPGDSIVVSIDLMITQAVDPADAYTNEAEISEAFEEDGTTPFDDVDSDADGDNTNDAGGSPLSDSDNSVDGTGINGMGVPDDTDGTTDEDDADPELIRVVDVAQTKMLVTAAPYSYGQEVEFTITTYNQGNVPLTDVVITDYIPDGFSLSMTSDDAGWDLSAAGAEFTITDVILPGASVETTIILVLEMTTGGYDNYTNVSEVSMMSDTLGMDVSGDDADSDINDDPNDNGGGEPNSDSDDSIDGDGTGMPGDEDAATDEDNSDPAFVEIFDLAVIMENSDDVITMYDQAITFPVTLTNQGNVDSEMPEVTVTVPDGFAFDSGANPGWVDNMDGTVTYTYQDTLMPGDLEMFNLVLTSQPATGADAWTPVVAITADNPIGDTPGLLDVDSDIDGDPTNDGGGNPIPDTNDNAAGDIGSDDSLTGDGTGAPGDIDPATDSDASDPEFVRIMDVAQTKMVVGSGPFEYGDTIAFVIETYNQGNIALVNTEISDYIPVGFTYSGAINAGWTGTDGPGDQTATFTNMDTIIGGTSVTDTINLILTMTDGGLDNYTNVSEVSFAQDTLGNDTDGNGPNGGLEDVDSDINNDPTDNGGGEPLSDSDDVVDGDGTGNPGDEDADTDEDNSDPAIVEVLDLAVAIEDNEDVITSYDQDITFPVTLTNQGNIPSDMPVVTVMVPDGFEFDGMNPLNAGWIDNMDGTVSYEYQDTLQPGDLETFNLVLTSQPATGADAWTPVIEITADNPIANDPTIEDIDSDPDADFTNDPGGNPSPDTNDNTAGDIGSDDALDGDGTGASGDIDPATDEDDNDPEFVRIMDVAQTKMVIGSGPYEYGDTVSFVIETYNQGNIALINTEISDYIPVGFTYSGAINAGWAGTDGPGDQTATYTIPDTILGGTSVVDTINLILTMTDGGLDNYTNVSEVSFAQDTMGNDTEGNGDYPLEDVDSDINNDPTDNGGGEPLSDSDDVVDGDGTGNPGDEDADTDEDNSDPAIVEVLDLAVAIEDNEDVITSYDQDITFPVTLTNQGNIPSDMPVVTVMVPDGFEFDGMNPLNAGWIDNMDGTVSYEYQDTLQPGDLETFNLVLTSQPATGADAWTPVIEITADNPIANDPTIEDIDSDPDADFTNDPGGNPSPDTNDNTAGDIGSDDALDGDGTGASGDIDPATDEDDNDPEFVRIMDVAQTKMVIGSGPYEYGDTVSFVIETYNQGNIALINTEISDYIPVGFTYSGAINTGWTGTDGPGDQTATYTIPDTILGGTSVVDTINLILTMTDGGLDNYTNVSEVSFAQDTMGNDTEGNGDYPLEDVDSDINDDPTDNGGGEPLTDSDDSIDGDGTGNPGDELADTDEDNSDPAIVEVFDLAVIMGANTDTITMYGQDVTFPITLTNQGNVASEMPVITVMVPDGFEFDLANNMGWIDNMDGTVSYTYPDTLAPGDLETINLVLTSQMASGPDAWTPIVEITEDNSVVVGLEDIDSDPDATFDNDAGGAANPDSEDGNFPGSDDILDGDGTGVAGDTNADTDEDDNDPELVNIFDLALTKTTMMMTGNSFGDTIEFMITVYNQGNVPATNIEITDFMPDGFGYVADNDAAGWMFDAGLMTATTTVMDTIIQPGDSYQLSYFVTIMMSNASDAFQNQAEISMAEDTTGNTTGPGGTLVDADSTPDDINGNDPGGEPGTDSDDAINGDGTNGGGMPGDEDADTDEDDSDPALIEVIDIALIKTVDEGQGPFKYGDNVDFTIAVINQGNVPLQNIKVSDYLPDGFIFNAADNGPLWMEVGGDLEYIVDGPMTMWDTVLVPLTLEIQSIAPSEDPNAWTNVAEVSEIFAMDENGDLVDVSGDDIDSENDNNATNNEGGTPLTDEDNEVDGDGFEGEDADNSDPALVQIFDLALTKQLKYPDSIYMFGEEVELFITIHNQGNTPATNIEVIDFVPVSLTDVGATNSIPWVFVGDTATYVYTDTLLAGTSDTLDINFIFQEGGTSLDDFVNYAEISQASDTLGGTTDGDLGDIVDADSTPDNIEDNDAGGNPSIGQDTSMSDNVVDGNGSGAPLDDNAETDEDDSDPAAIISCFSNCDIACQGTLNISLDQDCMMEIVPSMVGVNIESYCNFYYTVELTNPDGSPIQGTIIDESYIGKTVGYTLTEPECGNSCWGYLKVEDKFRPQIECVPDTVLCNASDTINVVRPIITRGCSNARLELVDERYENIDNDTLFTGRVLRRWKAVGVNGMESNICTQEIMIRRILISNITFPSNLMQPTLNNLSCDDNIELDNFGNPLPRFNNRVGVPTMGGQGLFPLEDGVICNGYVSYKDNVIQDTPCAKKIMRTWTIGEWANGTTQERKAVQIIEIVDTTAPVLTLLPDMNVSVSGFDCDATVNLPEVQINDNCNNIKSIQTLYERGFNPGNGGLATIPNGVSTVEYVVEDLCGNIARTSFTITVVDRADPIAICERRTNLPLLANVSVTRLPAAALDDGSFDECSDVTFKAMRMTPGCGVTPNVFVDTLDFCCTDAGTEQVVMFLVTDAGGNTNQCMVTVIVEDKTPPVITCVNDMTVSCDFAFDEERLGDFFDNPTIVDGCGADAYTFTNTLSGNRDDCGQGELTRTIDVLDASGRKLRTCRQNILFEGRERLVRDSIEWPINWTVIGGCDSTALNIDQLPFLAQEPRINGTVACSSIAVDYTDMPFVTTTNNPTDSIGCLKIIRRWVVVDWCSRVNGGSFDTFMYDQVLKLVNEEAPEFTSMLDSVDMCSYNANCQSDSIRLEVGATDDCTDPQDLTYSYVIDIYRDGLTSNDVFGSSNVIEGMFPIGNHLVTWTVSDRCGNTAQQEQVVTLRNCKAPQVVCLSGLTATLIPWDSNGSGTPDTKKVRLTPDYFDAGSGPSTNCGNPVLLSFSEDFTDTVRIYECSDVGDNPVELYVLDTMLGTFSYCETEIRILNTDTLNNLCDTIVNRVSIAGAIFTESNGMVESVEVALQSNEKLIDVTNVDGEYAFVDMPLGGTYSVIPSYDENHDNGVSTLDLVLIQRHILSLTNLTSPYKLLAADVNRDDRITGSDVVQLRKIILGKISEFENSESWRFVDGLYQFPDPLDPWYESVPEQYYIPTLDNDMEIDFVGVKVGDVNGSATSLRGEEGVDSRYGHVGMRIKDQSVTADRPVAINIEASESGRLYGWQYAFEGEMEIVSIAAGHAAINENNFALVEGGLKLSFDAPMGIDVEEGDVLFTIIAKPLQSANLSTILSIDNASPLRNEIYTGSDLSVRKAVIEWKDKLEGDAGFAVAQNKPNPWNDRTIVEFFIPNYGQVSIRVKDVTGRILKTYNNTYEAGDNTLTIYKDDLGKGGVLFYEVEYAEKVEVRKMILID